MRKIYLPIFFFFLFIFFFVGVEKTQAFSFGDIVNGIKNFFSPNSSQILTITSSISLTPGGDINKNGKIDSGDTVTFTYTITNNTQATYHLASLKTNINTKEINGINHVRGVLSLDEKNNTIIIPNLTLNSNQVRKISFDAQTDFNKDSDLSISTDAELVDDKNNSLSKAEKQEITVFKMDKDTFNKLTHVAKE